MPTYSDAPKTYPDLGSYFQGRLPNGVFIYKIKDVFPDFYVIRQWGDSSMRDSFEVATISTNIHNEPSSTIRIEKTSPWYEQLVKLAEEYEAKYPKVVQVVHTTKA